MAHLKGHLKGGYLRIDFRSESRTGKANFQCSFQGNSTGEATPRQGTHRLDSTMH